ncbi:hypothetical protein [Streptomyces chrestomyceticus]|uniref:hypothetical protein n=1 Tax=Streptomyces chrestomyceticus TaxID=68185 RepID=UPI0033DA65A4
MHHDLPLVPVADASGTVAELKLFSVPASGWWLIAVAASLLFVVGMRPLAFKKDPSETQEQFEQRKRRNTWLFPVGAPLALAAILATNLLRPEAAPPILFLYSVALVAVLAAVLPVLPRIYRQHEDRQRHEPGAKAKADTFTMVWITAVLCTAVVGAVLALMATPFGMRHR